MKKLIALFLILGVAGTVLSGCGEGDYDDGPAIGQGLPGGDEDDD